MYIYMYICIYIYIYICVNRPAVFPKYPPLERPVSMGVHARLCGPRAHLYGPRAHLCGPGALLYEVRIKTFGSENLKKCKKWPPGGQKIFSRSRLGPSRRAGFIFDVESGIYYPKFTKNGGRTFRIFGRGAA